VPRLEISGRHPPLKIVVPAKHSSPYLGNSVKLTTVQVTKLPLKRNLNEIDEISFAKPGPTEALYIMSKDDFSIIVRYIHFTKATTTQERQTWAMTARVQPLPPPFKNGRDPQEACSQTK
jgi:hypothetical protein